MSASASAAPSAAQSKGELGTAGERQKGKDVRASNIVAAKAVADAIRTSLGPRGMDKMISSGKGEVTITNDGATILKEMEVLHPAARMLVQLSESQDIEAGDGTTSVCVIAGSLLDAASRLLERSIHPTVISESFGQAVVKATEVLEGMSTPVELSDRDSLIKAATTSLNSKVVSQYSGLLAPIAVDAVLKVTDPTNPNMVDLKDIKVVSKVGGTIDDTQLVEGLVFSKGASGAPGAPKRIENAKIALLQFCLSAPKTDMDNQIIVSEYSQMDRILREERQYILNLCKKIKASGANVVLLQKSILRDAYNQLSMHFLAKMKIMVVTDIERDDIEFIAKTLGCRPVAHADDLTAEKLGSAAKVEEESVGGKIVRITGVPAMGKTVTVLVRGSNKLMVSEAVRSLHDALCVVRSIVKNPRLIVGGGAPEIEVLQQVTEWSKTLTGQQSYCVRGWAEALEVIPATLAENAGLNPIRMVTELRNRHLKGEKNAGINVRKGSITNSTDENVLQPLLVNTSAMGLATETVRMILKIDDIVETR